MLRSSRLSTEPESQSTCILQEHVGVGYSLHIQMESRIDEKKKTLVPEAITPALDVTTFSICHVVM